MGFTTRLVLVVTSVALATGCDGFQTSTLLPASGASKSWIAPDEGREHALLFAADSERNVISIYSLPKMKLKGELTGSNISDPQGLCTDSAGDVYVTEQGQMFSSNDRPEIDEYSRVGSLLTQIPDPYGFPEGCAVDPATGDLAVTNMATKGGLGGNLLIFPHGSSIPHVVTDPDAEISYGFPGYGPHSSLWVSGMIFNGPNVLLRCDVSTCTTITTSGTLYFSAGIEWDKERHTWVAFEGCDAYGPGACSVPVSETGRLGAQTVYQNYLGGSVCGFFQSAFSDDDKYVVGSSFAFCSGAKSAFYRWSSRTGGIPLDYVAMPSSTIWQPSGVAISFAPSTGIATSDKTKTLTKH